MTDSKPPKILFLDQNKWIELTRGLVAPDENPDSHKMARFLIEKIKAKEILVPLSFNLIIETYKINEDRRRLALAEVQSLCSQGLVFANRNRRLMVEVGDFARKCSSLAPIERRANWWLSNNFVESVIDWNDAIKEFGAEVDQLDGILADPPYALFHFLITTPPEERKQAMQFYSDGSNKVAQEIMQRMKRLKGQKIGMRKRVYSATLALDEDQRIFRAGDASGVYWRSASDIGKTNLKAMMREVPTYNVEIELATKIEAMDRPINENDLRDMQGFTAAIPYSDVVVGEKMFTNMARQAGLDQTYNCKMTTDLNELPTLL